MGLRFQRRIRILKGVSINLSKAGASVSVGPCGAKYTIGPKGARTTVGIPGTGISHTSYTPTPARWGVGKVLIALLFTWIVAYFVWNAVGSN